MTKISYVTEYDARDVHNWSGLGYYIAKSLQSQSAHIDYINCKTSGIGLMDSVTTKLFRLLGFEHAAKLGLAPSRGRGNCIGAKILPDADLVFSPSSHPISFLNTSKPKVFYTDATFASMLNFYNDYTGLSPAQIDVGNSLEKRAILNADLAIYSSDWAAQSAINDYGADPAKIKVIPFGANITGRREYDQVNQFISGRRSDRCHLLFVGVEWERKGGNVALEVTRLLNEIGIPTTLHIVGLRKLPFTEVPYYIKHHGFISKATKAGEHKLERLFAESHFLLLPTQADCTPVVFSEANSFGLPVLTTNVGGIGTVVKDGVNGKTFNPNTPPAEWAAYIEQMLVQREQYNALSQSAFHRYETLLNWNTAGKSIMSFLKQL
jgi:glycosyltransferase involved in cell wall biosynthesis